MRLMRVAVLCPLLLVVAPALRAEYIVLYNGQRLRVTGYELLGDKYRLQIAGGRVEVAASDVAAVEPEDIFTPAPPIEISKAPYRELIQAAAARYSVDADLITSVIATESNFDAKAISRRNARGLMQLLPETASRMGVRNIFDPQENIDAGARYLRDLLLRYDHDLALTLAAYNAGPERVQRYGRVPPFPETVSYIRRVRRAYNQRKSDAATARPTARKKTPLPPGVATTIMEVR